MKRLLPALLLLAFLPWATAQAEDEPRVRIGTWNIENLGSRRSKRRTDEDYAKIAAFIKDDLKVDVLGVQEINGSAPLARICKALGEDYTFLIGSSGSFRGSDKRISVGFIWNTKRVKMLGAEELLDLPSATAKGTYIFHRKPVVASFRSLDGGIDFRAVVVHLKAGRQNRGRRGARDSEKRQAEVKHLGERIQKLLATPGEDQDLVVLGDFNHNQSYPAHGVFKQWVKYLVPQTKHRSIVHFNEQIDHIAVSAGLAEEVVEASLTIHGAKADADLRAWRASFSDHMPVTVDLLAKRDGDPEATFTAPSAKQVLEAGVEPPANRQAEPTLPAGHKKKSFF